MNLRTAINNTVRWHNKPQMGHVRDTVAAHSARVQAIILTLWPDASRDLLIAALQHDAHEAIIGDMPGDAKAQFQALASAYDLAGAEVDREYGWAVDLPPVDRQRLKFADRLDALLLVQDHAPEWAETDEWVNAEAAICGAAEALGVAEALLVIFGGDE